MVAKLGAEQILGGGQEYAALALVFVQIVHQVLFEFVFKIKAIK